MDVGGVPRKLALCRICHDEDEPAKMESPCSCCGSLKYAHRRCIQMWCNQKGNITCEICQKEFKPGYSAPPPRSPFSVIPVRLREPWELRRGEQYIQPPIYAAEHHFFDHAAEHHFFDQSFNDYVAPTASIVCCRIIAAIFAVLLVLRHTLPIILYGAEEYSSMLYTLLMLRTVGILVSLFVMLQACSIIRRHRNRQTPTDFQFTSDEENELIPRQLPSHFIHIQ